jgi:hypothetical protein
MTPLKANHHSVPDRESRTECLFRAGSRVRASQQKVLFIRSRKPRRFLIRAIPRQIDLIFRRTLTSQRRLAELARPMFFVSTDRGI